MAAGNMGRLGALLNIGLSTFSVKLRFNPPITDASPVSDRLSCGRCGGRCGCPPRPAGPGPGGLPRPPEGRCPCDSLCWSPPRPPDGLCPLPLIWPPSGPIGLLGGLCTGPPCPLPICPCPTISAVRSGLGPPITASRSSGSLVMPPRPPNAGTGPCPGLETGSCGPGPPGPLATISCWVLMTVFAGGCGIWR